MPRAAQFNPLSWKTSAPVLASLLSLVCLACQDAGPVTASCPAPLPEWYSPLSGRTGRQFAYDVKLDGKEIFWEGHRTDEVELVQYLKLMRTGSPTPLIRFDPEKGADCAFATRIRDIIHEQYDCSTAKCWHGSPEMERATPFREGEGGLPW
jgi:hypothetical protein